MKLFTGNIVGYPVTNVFYIIIERKAVVEGKWIFNYLATNGYSYKSDIETISMDTSNYDNAVKKILKKIKDKYTNDVRIDEASPDKTELTALDTVSEIII